MRALQTTVTWKSFGWSHARIFKSRAAAEKFARARPPRFWRTKPILAAAGAAAVRTRRDEVDMAAFFW